MSAESTWLQIKKTALRHADGTPTDGLVKRGQSYHVDIPGEDKDNLIVQVLHIKIPMTHERIEQMGLFQKHFGLGTEATAQLIISLGIVQIFKMMESPFLESDCPPTES